MDSLTVASSSARASKKSTFPAWVLAFLCFRGGQGHAELDTAARKPGPKVPALAVGGSAKAVSSSALEQQRDVVDVSGAFSEEAGELLQKPQPVHARANMSHTILIKTADSHDSYNSPPSNHDVVSPVVVLECPTAPAYEQLKQGQDQLNTRPAIMSFYSTPVVAGANQPSRHLAPALSAPVTTPATTHIPTSHTQHHHIIHSAALCVDESGQPHSRAKTYDGGCGLPGASTLQPGLQVSTRASKSSCMPAQDAGTPSHVYARQVSQPIRSYTPSFARQSDSAALVRGYSPNRYNTVQQLSPRDHDNSDSLLQCVSGPAACYVPRADSTALRSVRSSTSLLSQGLPALSLVQAAYTGALWDSAGAGLAEAPILDISALETLSLDRMQHELTGLRWIGQGGDGVVFKAIWQGAPVAVKFLATSDPEQVNSSALEAVVSRVLGHPNVVQAYKYGLHRVSEDTLKPAAGGALSATVSTNLKDLLGSTLASSHTPTTIPSSPRANLGSRPATMDTQVDLQTQFQTSLQTPNSNGASQSAPVTSYPAQAVADFVNGGSIESSMATTCTSNEFSQLDHSHISNNSTLVDIQAKSPSVGHRRVVEATRPADILAQPASTTDLTPPSNASMPYSSQAMLTHNAKAVTSRSTLPTVSAGFHHSSSAPGLSYESSSTKRQAQAQISRGHSLGNQTAVTLPTAGFLFDTCDSFNSDDGYGDPDAGSLHSGSLLQILHFLGASPGTCLTHIVMEHCDRGSLLAAIKRGMFKPDAMRQTNGAKAERVILRAILRTARDVARGMCHLHASDIIHGDLKPGNVLLVGCRSDRRGFTAKVSDFGLCKVVTAGRLQQAHHWSTVTHMAPEVIQGSWHKASDVYSFGILLWQLCTSNVQVYPGLEVPQVLMGVSNHRLTPVWPSSCHPALVKLGQVCLQHSYQQRPSFRHIERALTKIESHIRNELKKAKVAVPPMGQPRAGGGSSAVGYALGSVPATPGAAAHYAGMFTSSSTASATAATTAAAASATDARTRSAGSGAVATGGAISHATAVARGSTSHATAAARNFAGAAAAPMGTATATTATAINQAAPATAAHHYSTTFAPAAATGPMSGSSSTPAHARRSSSTASATASTSDATAIIAGGSATAMHEYNAAGSAPAPAGSAPAIATRVLWSLQGAFGARAGHAAKRPATLVEQE